jgi:hypothetical protein
LLAGFVDGSAFAWPALTNILRNLVAEFGRVALARTKGIDAAITSRTLFGYVIALALTNLSNATWPYTLFLLSVTVANLDLVAALDATARTMAAYFTLCHFLSSLRLLASQNSFIKVPNVIPSPSYRTPCFANIWRAR